VVLFNAYIDESYTDGCDPAILVVGGYLMRADEAEQMEADWQRILRQHGVDHFHMKDVAPAGGDFKFLGMPGSDALARDVIGCILSHELEGFAAVINLQRPTRLPPAAFDLYTSGLEACLNALMSNTAQKDPEAKVMFYFEDGHASQGIADEFLKTVPRNPTLAQHFLGHKFCGKKEKCLLQAADVLVWQTAKFIKDKYRKARKPRGDFLALAEKPTMYHYLYKYRGMPEMYLLPARAAQSPQVDHVFRRMFDPALLTMTYTVGSKAIRKEVLPTTVLFIPQVPKKD
jgi:hypothetical protein